MIKKYEAELRYIGGSEYIAFMNQDDSGGYVSYEDHIIEVKKLESLNADYLHTIKCLQNTRNELMDSLAKEVRKSCE